MIFSIVFKYFKMVYGSIYKDAFTELALTGQKTWNDDDIKKPCFVQNAQNIDLVDTGFEELVIDKSIVETLRFP
jgi:hypothetical protein